MTEKVNEKSSNDNKQSSPIQPAYSTRRTNFGNIRVDTKRKTADRQLIESLLKIYDPTNERNRTFDTQIWSLVDEDSKKNPNDIDYYGLINAHFRNFNFEKQLESPTIKEEIQDNYIDQLAFPELTTKATETKSTTKLQKETIEDLKNEQMTFIDEQYFGTSKHIQYHDEPIDATTPTKRIEMPPAHELNYIDQMFFAKEIPLAKEMSENQTTQVDTTKPLKKTQKLPNADQEQNKASATAEESEKVIRSNEKISKSQSNSSDKLLDINFQFRISTESQKPKKTSKPALNETPMDTYNPKLETMRSIKSKDYFDPPRHSALDIQKAPDIESSKSASEPAEQIRESLQKKTNTRDSLGYRTFETLVPKWSTMTKAEIVDILLKQICFIRRGPGVRISIAHFIPEIIERLNKPEIRQLHLVHRLDRQSTGVLLMTYSTEAEKQLRELIQERKIIKQYLTIVRGIPKPDTGEINIPIVERNVRGTYKMMLSPTYNELTKLVMPKGKRDHVASSKALTKYRVIDSNYGVSLVECQPVTGVKHQIRTHLAHATGTPILGDHKYSHYAKLAPQKLPFATLQKLGVRQAKVRTIPLCLHSYSVAIPNFLHHQQNIFIRARLPHHMRYFIQNLRLRMIK